MTPAALSVLHRAAFCDGRGWSEDEFTTLLAQKGVSLCTTAHAFALIRVIMDEAELLTLATDPAHQRKGEARVTLQDAENRAAEAGATRIFLEVAADNNAARGLYQSSGYTQIGQRPAYYARRGGRPVTALVLGKDMKTA